MKHWAVALFLLAPAYALAQTEDGGADAGFTDGGLTLTEATPDASDGRDAGAIAADAFDAGALESLANGADAGITVANAEVAATPSVVDAGEPELPVPTLQTVVTATRTEQRAADVVVATEVITRREIEATGARDLAELLETQPGVELTQSFRGTGIRLQGLDPEYVLILVDGERIGGRIGNTLDLSRFSLQDVEQVEIVKGPAAAVYGSEAMGGVINLVTRHPHRPFEADGRAGYGTLNRIDARGGVGTLQEHYELRGNASYRHNDGWDQDPTTPATSGSANSLYDLSVDGAWKPTEKIRIAGRTSYTYRDQFAIDQAPGGAVFDRRFRDEFFDASLAGTFTPMDGTAISARVHNSIFRDQLLQDQHQARDLDQYEDARDRLWEAQLQLDQRLGASHLVTAALEGLFERAQAIRIEGGHGGRDRYALALQDDWRILNGAQKLALNFGGRIDQDSVFGTALSPRVAVKFDPTNNLTLRASYGWGFRAPSFQELYLRFENPAVGYVVQGNPKLRPEESRGYNVAADYQLNDDVTVSASLFRTDLFGLVDIVTLQEQTPDSPTRFSYGNVQRAYTQGGEATARLRLVRGVFLDLGYSLTDAQNVSQQRRLEGRPLHRATANLTARYRPFGLEFNLRASYTDRRPFFVDNDGDGVFETVWTKPYGLIDARVAKQITSWLSAYVVANNLLNAGDPSFLFLPPMGVQGGLQARY